MTNLNNKTKEELLELAEGLTVLRDKTRFDFVSTLYKKEGPLGRKYYPRHMEFLNGGAKYGERLFSAANQVGKTLTLLLEGYYHASGRYPDWWEGKRFRRPNIGLFGAQTWEHIRTGIQAKLLTGADRGDMERGAGVIPKTLLDTSKYVPHGNVSGVYAEIWIPHITGGYSKILFKTYDSGQEKWESMTVNWVMLDEEPPMDVYTEAAMRIIANDGTIAIGFTPDSGLTETVLQFFKNGEFTAGAVDDKLVVMVGWDDVPHLSEKAKKSALSKIPEYLVEAKTKGIPYLGEGRVFQFDLSKFVEKAVFKIPEHFSRAFAIDPGIKNAAILWLAIDPDTGITYIYSEHGAHQQSIYSVADVIKGHGDWIPGVMDPFYGPQSSRESAAKIIDLYRETGLDIELCDRKGSGYKEGGIETVKVAFLTGKLRIFPQCTQLISQLNIYHRNKKGKTGNTPDDFVDALRYAITGGIDRAMSYPDMLEQKHGHENIQQTQVKRNPVTGY